MCEKCRKYGPNSRKASKWATVPNHGIQKARGSSPLISTIWQDSRPDHRAVFLLPPFNSTTQKRRKGFDNAQWVSQI
jgi:hypothetical protein